MLAAPRHPEAGPSIGFSKLHVASLLQAGRVQRVCRLEVRIERTHIVAHLLQSFSQLTTLRERCLALLTRSYLKPLLDAPGAAASLALERPRDVRDSLEPMSCSSCTAFSGLATQATACLVRC